MATISRRRRRSGVVRAVDDICEVMCAVRLPIPNFASRKNMHHVACQLEKILFLNLGLAKDSFR